MSSTQILTRDAYGVTYADPTDPDFTVRFKTSRTNKSLGGNLVENYLTEIIVNDLNEVTTGSVTANDAVSVRIRVSGALDSKQRIESILESIGAQLSSWTGENVLLGFEPSTAPVNPPAV